MSDAAQQHSEQVTGAADTPMATEDKGKGKSAAEPMEEDDSEESSGEENEGEAEEPDEDNMEEIDTDNIVAGRTRGRNIDFAQAARDLPADEDEEDDEEDDDFEDEDDRMQE